MELTKELNIENLEQLVKNMGSKSHSVKNCPKFLVLSNFAIGLGFTAQSAKEFIKQEMENQT